MNISIGENCLNKRNPIEYIVAPPSRGVGTTEFTLFKLEIHYHGHIFVILFKSEFLPSNLKRAILSRAAINDEINLSEKNEIANATKKLCSKKRAGDRKNVKNNLRKVS